MSESPRPRLLVAILMASARSSSFLTAGSRFRLGDDDVDHLHRGLVCAAIPKIARIAPTLIEPRRRGRRGGAHEGIHEQRGTLNGKKGVSAAATSG